MREDTIAAIATAVGEGGIGIIRISGENAKNILEEIFMPISKHRRMATSPVEITKKADTKSEERKNVFLPESLGETIGAPIVNRRLTYGHILDESGNLIDEVLAIYMKAPYTYTAEDVVEINCHGSVISLQKTLALVLRKGARIAEPGEFTKRAFLNGRLDLSQAEAVMDLISAKTDKGFDNAISQLSGTLSKEVKEIRKMVQDVLVEMTVNIDYPDEDIEELTYEKLENSLSQIGDKIEKLLSTSSSGKILKDGLRVAIVGKPNVGKSSLMNALLRESRAIVTDIAGTTRDTIEEFLNIGGIPVKLYDTAGIRQTEDTIEKIGIERSISALENSDLVIFMLDSHRQLEQEDLEIIEHIKNKKVIILLNKTDLGEVLTEDEVLLCFTKSHDDEKNVDAGLDTSSTLEKKTGNKTEQIDIIKASVNHGIGLELLEEKIKELVYQGKVVSSDTTLLTNTRHIDLLEKSLSSINDGLEITRLGEALDIIEIDVKSAFDYLGEITGETAAEEIIDEVFARFCLGK